MVKIPSYPVAFYFPCLARMRTATRNDGNDSTVPSHSSSRGEDIVVYALESYRVSRSNGLFVAKVS